MNTCPNCGKIAGLHSSILQGCMCQYSMQAPPQRTWIGLTADQAAECWTTSATQTWKNFEAKLKELNT